MSDDRAFIAPSPVAQTCDTPTYAPPRPASSPPPMVVNVFRTSRSTGTDGSATGVPGPGYGFGGGASVSTSVNCSSAKDSHSGNVPDGVNTEVNKPGGNAARGGAASQGVPSTSRGDFRRRAAQGRRRPETRQCVSFESTVVEHWAKRLRCSVMRDIIVTVRLWGV